MRMVKNMRLKNVSYFIVTSLVLLSILMTATLLNNSQKFREMRRSSESFMTFEDASQQLQFGSDYLTNQVRVLVETGDMQFMDAYFEEVNVKRNREMALETLKENFGDYIEISYLENALQTSTELMDLEYEAMKIVALAVNANLETLPQEVQNALIPEDVLSLSSIDQLEYAKGLVHGMEYQAQKSRISRLIASCMNTMLEKVNHEQELATIAYEKSYAEMRFIIVLVVLEALAIMILLLRRVVRPLTNYNNLVQESKRLPQDAFYELNTLAGTYNQVVLENEEAKKLLRNEAANLLTSLEFDKLTGLYTKSFFYSWVEQFLKTENPEDYMLIASDIEDLKLINEKYGLDFGNRIIRDMSDAHMCLPNYVAGSRFESDCNIIIVKSTDSKLYEDHLYQIFSNFHKDEAHIVVKHAFYHMTKGHDIRDMCDRVLLALGRIKGVFGTYFTVYDDGIHRERLRRQEVIDFADDGILNEEFKVYYQPKHNTLTGQLVGAEALVRWIHPDLGFMNPGLFIPVFEENGFITKLDEYVVKHVCADLANWQNNGFVLPAISVNISRRDFADETLADWILSVLDSYDLDHTLLHVEVTESAYSDNPEKMVQTVKKLHHSGVKIELDDFGTGYSYLASLNQLDIDILKLDRSLVIQDQPGSQKNILELTMMLAKMIHVETVAEGVETKAQAERMQELEVDNIQGYYYSKPLSKEQFEQYMLDYQAMKKGA